MQGRMKTALEAKETLFQESQRLRFALLMINSVDTLEEAKRIAMCTMGGELHGYEIKTVLDAEEFYSFPGGTYKDV